MCSLQQGRFNLLSVSRRARVSMKHVPVVCRVLSRASIGRRYGSPYPGRLENSQSPEIAEKLLGFMAEGKEPASLKVSKGKDGGFQYKFS